MIKAVFVACALASVSAFVPARQTSSRNAIVMKAAERSKSIPFLLRPVKLDGKLAGDEGFDPLGLSNI